MWASHHVKSLPNDTISLPIILGIFMILCFIIIFAIITIKTVIAKTKKRMVIVQNTSILIQTLLEINSKFEFDWNVQKQYTFRILLPSKAKYDKYELIHLLDENILKDNKLVQAAVIVANNRILYGKYLEAVEQLQSKATREQARKLHIPYKKYIKYENALFLEQQLKPTVDSDVICIAEYTSPQGRNHYSKTATYKIDEMPERHAILQQQIASLDSEETRRKRARSKMTDKLRYSILKRDGFRCKICGRTAEDGVKLHVDHIMPVSKGGETISSNLRTLCETCNWGKSDEIE